MAGPVISITLLADSNAAKAAIDRFFAGVNSSVQTVKNLGAAWQGVTASIQGIGGALAAYFGVSRLGGFVREAKDARSIMASLNAEITKSGEPVREFSDELAKHRESLKGAIGADDELSASVQRMLLTMNIGRKDTRQFTTDVFDLAATMRVDAFTAAKQLGNALNGDTIGLKGLKIDIDQTLPKTQQLADFLAKLRQRISGQAVAQFIGGAPEVDRLTVAMGELRKEVGNIVIDSGVITVLKDIVNWMRSLSDSTKAAIVNIGMLSTALIGLTVALPILKGLAGIFASIAGAIGLANFMTLGSFIPALKSLADIKAFGWLTALATGLTLGKVAIVAELALVTSELVKWLRAENQERTALVALQERNHAWYKAIAEQSRAELDAKNISAEQWLGINQRIQNAAASLKAGHISQAEYNETLKRTYEWMQRIKQPATKAVEPPDFRIETQAEIDARTKGIQEIQEAERASRLATLKDRYTQQLISDKEYFDARREMVQGAVESEKAIIEATMADLDIRETAIPTSELNFDERQKAIVDISKARIDATTRLNVLEQKQRQDMISLGAEEREVELKRLGERLTAQQKTFEMGEAIAKQNRTALESNWRLTEDEKAPLRIQFLKDEVAAYDQEISRLKALAEAQGVTADARQAYEEIIAGYTQKRFASDAELSKEEAAPDPFSFMDQFTLRMKAVQQQWGSMARNMAQIMATTLTSAVDGVSNALANVITGAQSAGQAFQQLAVQMVTSLIASIMQAILYATIAIPILTALGVLSGGAIPSMGLVNTTAALAGASSLASRYADGGRINVGTGPRADDVLIRASRGEFVLNAAAVNYYGESFITALNRRMIDLRDLADAIPRGVARPIAHGSYADGGYVDAGVSSGGVNVLPAPVNVAVLNDRQHLTEWMEKHGAPQALAYIKKHKHELGVKS